MTKGRKGYGEELQIIQRYADLKEPYFNFLKDKILNGTEQEKWDAVKVLKGAFEKMIPQDLGGDLSGNIILQWAKEQSQSTTSSEEEKKDNL